eukprot:CAMPEP_0206009892 /NCGR_PEP_ID=MMETSP1464-20131121/10557_1 /ASSEMBLY_ACC=CAM_ASM_001124 /TAXON_ID=119497 /ORGANISM="Exanthemachrysis gayraliae, Strain RCC1523" /LENGTH=316 /DNA_ID=CAMNT_0053383497 /DNA_START=43 /DNA_END=989 /DNA_ORIENTATION=+
MPPKAKFEIKPFRQAVAVDDDYVRRTWTVLRDAIGQIFAHNASNLSFEELYRNGYNMVLHKHGDRLYDGLSGAVTSQLQTVAAAVESAPDAAFLEVLIKRWDDHKLSMIMIRDILMYMDRTYVTVNKKTPVYELGLNAFRDVVIRSAHVRDRLVRIVLGVVERERRGELVDRPRLRQVTAMLAELGKDVYAREFERPFLEATSDFYRRESAEVIANNPASAYLEYAERRLEEEGTRAAHYMDPATEPKLRAVAERELVAHHMAAIVEMEHSGLVPMLDHGRYGDLARMYALFKRVTEPHGLSIVRDVLAHHAREQG